MIIIHYYMIKLFSYKEVANATPAASSLQTGELTLCPISPKEEREKKRDKRGMLNYVINCV